MMCEIHNLDNACCTVHYHTKKITYGSGVIVLCSLHITNKPVMFFFALKNTLNSMILDSPWSAFDSYYSCQSPISCYEPQR